MFIRHINENRTCFTTNPIYILTKTKLTTKKTNILCLKNTFKFLITKVQQKFETTKYLCCFLNYFKQKLVLYAVSSTKVSSFLHFRTCKTKSSILGDDCSLPQLLELHNSSPQTTGMDRNHLSECYTDMQHQIPIPGS